MDTKRIFEEDMAQEKDFTYLDTADFSTTVCDREGKVLYQNEKAVLRDGNVTGGNPYDKKYEEKLRKDDK